MAHSEAILYNPVYHFHIKYAHHEQHQKVYFTLSEIRNAPIPCQYITYKVPGRLFAQELTAESTHRLVNSSPTNSTLLVSESTDIAIINTRWQPYQIRRMELYHLGLHFDMDL